MADNTVLNAGSGGDTIATDDIAGVKHQRVKVQHGADGSATDVSSASPMPVDWAGTSPPIGAGVEATALRVTVATDSTVSVDDNGGSLTVDGTVTLAANSGVDIGDVDVTSQVPGTGATNLGKAIDTPVGGTDTGVAMLGKHQEDQVHLTSADGDYDVLTLDSLGSLHVNPESHHVFDSFNATTGWTVLGNDTANLATTKKHALGTDALTFDKVDGAANTIFAGIQKTLTSVDIGAVSPHDLLQSVFYIPTITDVAYVFLRLGTDSSNYSEWQVPVANLVAATFTTGALTIGDVDHDAITGNGMIASAITYIAVGVAFNAETNTLAGIIFDEVSYHTNQHSSTQIAAEVTSSVSSANINLHKIGGSVTDKGSGNASNGSQRVVLATDDVNASAITAAVELIDDTVKADDAAFTLTTDKVSMAGAIRDDALATLTAVEGDAVPLRVGSTGALHVDGSGATQPVSGTVTANLSATDNAVLDDIAAQVTTVAGAVAVGQMQVDIVADGAGLATAANQLPDGHNVTVDNASIAVTNGGTFATQATLQAGSALVGDVGLSGARTSGGTTLYKNIDVDETEDEVKGTAGQLYWLHAINLTASVLYLKLFNATAATVVVGTTVPDLTFPIPTQGDTNGAGFMLSVPNGIAFSTAISVACTTALADNDSGAPAANACVVNLGYA